MWTGWTTWTIKFGKTINSRFVSNNKYPAFFEKEIGGSGGRGKTFFLVKKSFSSSPRFPSVFIKNSA